MPLVIDNAGEEACTLPECIAALDALGCEPCAREAAPPPAGFDPRRHRTGQAP